MAISDPFDVSTEGGVLPSDIVPFKHSGLVVGDIGKPVKISANETVALAGDGEECAGYLARVDADTCGVKVRGDHQIAYAGSDPGLGGQAIVGGGSGKVKLADLEDDAASLTWVKIWYQDTTNKIIRFQFS